MSAQQDLFFDCYITLLWGPPCSVPAVDSEVPPAFPAQLLHSTQMSEGAAEDRVWGERGAVGVVSGPRSSGCLSQVNKCVCAHRSGKEGHTHAHTQQKEEKKKKNSGGGAPVAAAVFRVQTMQDNWNVPIGCQGLEGVSWPRLTSSAFF